jgi:hypothetical protein
VCGKSVLRSTRERTPGAAAAFPTPMDPIDNAKKVLKLFPLLKPEQYQVTEKIQKNPE